LIAAEGDPRPERTVRTLSTAAGDPQLGSDSSTLFLNTYAGTGIGDFGMAFKLRLGGALDIRSELTTDPAGGSYLSQLRAILGWPGTVIANVGLTPFGNSRVRNFLGLSGIGVRASLGRPTIVLLHNVIEAIRVRDSGFGLSRLGEAAAHLVVLNLRRARIVVFSATVAEQLRRAYGIEPSVVTTIPCDVPAVPAAIHRPMRVVSLGYLSPYKGFDTLLELKARFGQAIDITVVGGPHRLLASTVGYSAYYQQLVNAMRSSGISHLWQISEERLDLVLRSSSVAALPYKSTQGASSAFSRCASAGLPVVASDLPEFRALEKAGAGILLTSPDPDSWETALRRVLQDDSILRRLATRQIEFCHAHSWDAFVAKLNPLVRAGQ